MDSGLAWHTLSEEKVEEQDRSGKVVADLVVEGADQARMAHNFIVKLCLNVLVSRLVSIFIVVFAGYSGGKMLFYKFLNF